MSSLRSSAPPPSAKAIQATTTKPMAQTMSTIEASRSATLNAQVPSINMQIAPALTSMTVSISLILAPSGQIDHLVY